MQDDTLKRETRRQKIRLKKRRRLVAVGILILALVLSVLMISLIVNGIKSAKRGVTQSIGPNPPTEDTKVASVLYSYDYGAPAPKSEAVESGYFDDALFVGDARTSGFSIYGYMKKATILTGNSLNVGTVLECEFADSAGAKFTLVDKLADQKFSKIYLALGLNELGWGDPDAFADEYDSFVGTLLTLQPGAEIYIESILPVSKNASGRVKYMTNEKIEQYNASLKVIAKNKQVYYLDVAEVFKDGEGCLDSAVTGDGIHLLAESYSTWFEYLKTHTVKKELYTN
ncbi:MAG: GDSL-type esterase/lipase family protein [Oscillospiraceae bacterium]